MPQIYIPSSVTKIGEVAFPYGFFSEIETKLYGEKGSYGEEYAKKYGYTFVVGNLPNVETNVIISQSGTFPSGQQWNYNADTQTMTLTGKGKIEGYDYHSDYYSLFRKVGDATKQLVIGEGITGFDSWWSFSKMEGISLPKSLCLIGEDDWGDEYCVITGREFSHLFEFKVSSDNPYHTCENGILFSKDKTTLVSYPPKKMGHSYSIPKTVKTIGKDAFYGCTNLRNITIPEGVKKIGDRAFMNCNYLSSIVVPDSVTELGKGAFADCSVLENAVLGKNITQLNGTFAGCKKLESILLPDGLKNIDYAWLYNMTFDTFDGCDSLKRIFIPKNVTTNLDNYGGSTSISFIKLSSCINLSEITVDSENITYASVNGVLLDKSKKTLICCPAGKTGTYTVPSTVTEIKYGAFASSQLTSIIIPKTVTSIGDYIFEPSWPATAESKVSHIYYAGTQQEWKNALTDRYGDLNSLGKDDITIHYNSSGPSVTAVTIKSMPTKKTYTVGESFAPAGMILKATYDDGTAKEITSGFTYTPTGKLTTAGQQKIVVSYGGKSTGFYVTVNEASKTVSSVTIAKKPTKQTYTVGESFNATGMKLKVTYADNTTAEITSGFTCTPSGKLTAAGQQKIVVSYGGKSTGFYVTVTKAISSVTIAKKPTKQTYTVGETFNATGMKLKVTYADNTTSEITSGFTYTPTGKLTTMGQQKIVVSYGGKSTGFYVTVNEASKTVSSVTIAKKPTKQTYTVGESFNCAGMKLKVTYTDNTTSEITSGFTYTPTGKLTTAGQQKIVVSYGGKSTGFYVTVNKAVSSVTIAKKPTKQTYTVGESFNAAGMKLKVTYTDNTTAEITSGFTCTPSGKLTAAGQQKIVVSYGGKSTGFYVTVQ